MNDVAKGITMMVVASIIATYTIREIETGFWRSKHYYGNAKRFIKSKLAK
jgi:hypothetical protein